MSERGSPVSHNIAELIGLIRDQEPISDAEIDVLVDGLVSGRMSDAQAGAFAMAVLCRGLDEEAAFALTRAMRDSGDVLTWDVDGRVVDKHSTGGVGDCVSLALAPILAASGLYNPMISGRGLGHTGGTLDKLEAIEGFRTALSLDEMRAQLNSVGCFIASASAELAPADRRLYAIRDVTGTVPSRDLITASILSKKLAAGLDELVLDVKCGRGAFMKTREDAIALAAQLTRTSEALGCRAKAFVSAMDESLARSAGNALEVIEILDLLEGKTDSALYTVTAALAGGFGISEQRVRALIESGQAGEKFEAFVAAQGGPATLSEIRASLPEAQFVREIYAKETAEFTGFDAYELGMIVVELGGGRTQYGDAIDPAVGLSHIAKSGKVRKGDVIARIHANDEAKLAQAEARIATARLQPSAPQEIIIEVGNG